MELALVYEGTPMLATPLKGRLALVYHYTCSALFLRLMISFLMNEILGRGTELVSDI